MAKIRKMRLSRMAESILRAEEAKERLRASAAAGEAEVRALLGAKEGGLSAAEAKERCERLGANVLPAGKSAALSGACLRRSPTLSRRFCARWR